MRYIAKISELEGYEAKLELLERINLERLETMFGDLSDIECTITFKDPRSLTDRQRKLYRALLNDIVIWNGDYDSEQLHTIFKEMYFFETGNRISTSKRSSNSKSDMNELLNIVLDFMFQYDVPFKKGYELLPKLDNWYLYQCCKHRKCAVCGSHADIHHIDAVGSGSNRRNVDHTKKLVIALCRKHHGESHNRGNDDFLATYHLAGIYLDYDDFKALGLMSQKLIDELTGKGEK